MKNVTIKLDLHRKGRWYIILGQGVIITLLPFHVIIELERSKTMDIQNNTRWDFIGLSTDSKPTSATSNRVVDGSTFYEADTSKLYFWCVDQWYEKTSNVLTNIERKMKW